MTRIIQDFGFNIKTESIQKAEKLIDQLTATMNDSKTDSLQYVSALDKLDSIYKTIGTSIDGNKKAIEDYSKAIAKNKEEIEKLEAAQKLAFKKGTETQINRLKEETENYEKALSNLNGEVEDASKLMTKYGNSVNIPKNSIEGLEKETNDLEKAQRRLDITTKQGMARYEQLGAQINANKRLMDDLTKGIDRNKNANNAAAQSGNGFVQSLGSLAAKGAGALLTMQALSSTIGYINEVIKTRSEFETFQAQLETATGSMLLANAQLANLGELAKKTPFSVKELVDVFAKFQLKGISLTNDELVRMGDLASALGKPIEKVAEAIFDVNDPLRWKELGIQVSTTGNKVKAVFKEQTKVYENNMKGALDMVKAFGSLEGVMGGMEKRSKTLGGVNSNLADSFDLLADAIGAALSPALIAASQNMTEFNQKITNTLKLMAELSTARQAVGQRDISQLNFGDLFDVTNLQGVFDAWATIGKFPARFAQDMRAAGLVEEVNKMTSSISEFKKTEQFIEVLDFLNEKLKDNATAFREGEVSEKDYELRLGFLYNQIQKVNGIYDIFIKNRDKEKKATEADAEALRKMLDLYAELSIRLRQARLDTVKLADAAVNERNLEEFTQQIQRQAGIDIARLLLENKKAIQKIREDGEKGKIDAATIQRTISVQNALTQEQIRSVTIKADIQAAVKREEIERKLQEDILTTAQNGMTAYLEAVEKMSAMRKAILENAEVQSPEFDTDKQKSSLEAFQKLEEIKTQILIYENNNRSGKIKASQEKLQKELAELEDKKDLQSIIRRDEILNLLQDLNNADANKRKLSEEKLSKELLQIQKESLETQIAYLTAAGLAYTKEWYELQNRLSNINKEITEGTKKTISEQISGFLSFSESIINAFSEIYTAFEQNRQKALEKDISSQEKRVESARRIAEKGNAEQLELEEKRLRDLEKKKEASARRQQAIASIAAISNSIVAITEAATAPPPFNLAAIAAVIAAIAGGIGAVTNLIGGSFADGVIDFKGKGKINMKGVGGPKEDRNLAWLSTGETVTPAEKTRKSMRVLTDVHNGKLDDIAYQKLTHREVTLTTIVPRNAEGFESQVTALNSGFLSLRDGLDRVVQRLDSIEHKTNISVQNTISARKMKDSFNYLESKTVKTNRRR